MADIKVVQKVVGAEPVITTIANELKALQTAVGGYIETVSFVDGSDEFSIVCDEEGKLKGKEANIRFEDDIIVGNIIIVKIEEDDFISMTDAEAERIIQFVKERMI